MPPITLTVATPSVDFHVELRGDQPHAVFVHGSAGDLHLWDAVWSAIGERLSTVGYDLRGHGQSVCKQQVPYTHANDLLTVLDAAGIDQCDLVGVSMGGAIALNFTLDHPQRVRNLVLISPGLVAWEWTDTWLRLWQPIVEQARSGNMDEARRLWWQHPLFETTRTSAAGPLLWQSIQRYSGTHWLDDPHQLMLPDVERLHLLTTRTLLLTGGRDFEDFRIIADLIEASAQHLQRHDDPARGHLLNLEDPAGCAGKILAFLN